ncbi:MAG: sensor histidine kinase [Bryobacteraceae bacterium]|nr:sensor histidine kinase [Bryobacteraceae bacterium]
MQVASEDHPLGQQAVSQLPDVCEQYRKLVAYEIHDGVVQCLTGALMNLEASLRIVGNGIPAAAKEGLDRTEELLRTGIAEARRLMNGLRPEILEDCGLIAALDCLVREGRERTNTSIEWSHSDDFDRLAPPLETTVFRIVQEGLANALRHSGSKKVRIALSQENHRIRAVVEDWGRGFDPGRVAQSRFGLQGIRQRAKMFGGEATIDSAPGKGTRIVVDLPLVET